MGKNLVKHPDHVRRRARLVMFCTEIKRAMFGLCLDHNVPTGDIDFFIEEFFVQVEYQECEYDSTMLLEMLLDTDFIKGTFERFRDRA